MKAVFSFVMLIIVMTPASGTYAQTENVVTVPRITREDLGRARKDIYTTPVSLTLLPHSPEAHSGKIWIRATDDGLHLWGKIDADERGFHWPQQKSEMLSSDHIEVWLATTPEVVMPEIGWGNQFGMTKLGSAKDCADQVDPHAGEAGSGAENCERWYTEQVQYRQYLRRLFVRQWLIAGSGNPGNARSFEDFASTAYTGLNSSIFSEDLPKALKPETDDGLSVEIGTEVRPEDKQNAAGATYKHYRQTGYNFHMFIPYRAFPPAQQLKLAELYLMVDVFSSAGAGHKMGDYSSTATMRKWGQPATFNRLRLAMPQTFSVTPCGYKLEQEDLYGTTYESWFFPTQSAMDTDLRSTFALINPAGGYMYAPAGNSPEVEESSYFWKKLTDGATLCGPVLAWHKGSEVTRSKFVVDEEHFEAKSLPDGWTLVRSGPTSSTLSAFGSGECGACRVMGFDIFAVSPQGEISSALAIHEELTGSGGQPSAADLSIAPDWKQIVLFRETVDPQQRAGTTPWTSTTYCLGGHSYKQCGESK